MKFYISINILVKTTILINILISQISIISASIILPQPKVNLDPSQESRCFACIRNVTTIMKIDAKRCDGTPNCGPYQISYTYWAEAGKPLGNPNKQGAFTRDPFELCARDPQCAEQSIRAYFKKFKRDCNNDHQIDCLDMAALHKGGPSGCGSDWFFKSRFWVAFNKTSCMQQASPSTIEPDNRVDSNNKQKSSANDPNNPQAKLQMMRFTNQSLTSECLDCICEATSGCSLNANQNCGSTSAAGCGPFAISQNYWRDGKRPGASWTHCAKSKDCSIVVVRNYMDKHKRDCTNDQIINCEDYAALHRMGPRQCINKELYKSSYWNKFLACRANQLGSANQPQIDANLVKLTNSPSLSSSSSIQDNIELDLSSFIEEPKKMNPISASSSTVPSTSLATTSTTIQKMNNNLKKLVTNAPTSELNPAMAGKSSNSPSTTNVLPTSGSSTITSMSTATTQSPLRRTTTIVTSTAKYEVPTHVEQPQQKPNPVEIPSFVLDEMIDLKSTDQNTNPSQVLDSNNSQNNHNNNNYNVPDHHNQQQQHHHLISTKNKDKQSFVLELGSGSASISTNFPYTYDTDFHVANDKFTKHQTSQPTSPVKNNNNENLSSSSYNHDYDHAWNQQDLPSSSSSSVMQPSTSTTNPTTMTPAMLNKQNQVKSSSQVKPINNNRQHLPHPPMSQQANGLDLLGEYSLPEFPTDESGSRTNFNKVITDIVGSQAFSNSNLYPPDQSNPLSLAEENQLEFNRKMSTSSPESPGSKNQDQPIYSRSDIDTSGSSSSSSTSSTSSSSKSIDTISINNHHQQPDQHLTTSSSSSASSPASSPSTSLASSSNYLMTFANESTQFQTGSGNKLLLSECLECICEASSNCDTSVQCISKQREKNRCGLYMISWNQFQESDIMSTPMGSALLESLALSQSITTTTTTTTTASTSTTSTQSTPIISPSSLSSTQSTSSIMAAPTLTTLPNGTSHNPLSPSNNKVRKTRLITNQKQQTKQQIDDSIEEKFYIECSMDKLCAERLINLYVEKHQKDCNNDGKIDCFDIAALHRVGPDNCASSKLLDSQYWKDFNSCFAIEPNNPDQLLQQQQHNKLSPSSDHPISRRNLQ